MNKLLKLLGAAALVASLTPYKVSKDDETGKVNAKALLWNLSYTPATGEQEKKVDVNFGLNVPGKEAEDETHIYTDDVTVTYAAEAGEAPAEEPAAADKAAEEKVEEVTKAAEAAEAKAEEAVQAAQAVEEKAEEAAAAEKAEEAAQEKTEDAGEKAE